MDQDDAVNYRNKWLFDITKKPVPQASQQSFGRIKAYLYESLHSAITRHNTLDCFRLLKILPKATSVDPYILFRLIMILVESNSTKTLRANTLTHLERLVGEFDVCRPEVFVELLAYFMRHNRIGDAKEFFKLRHKAMESNAHRPVPYIRVNISCYEFLLNYLDWSAKAACENSKSNFDVSMQGWIVNAIEKLKSTVGNYEYFVICLTQVLVFHGFTKKAYLFVSEFQRYNPNNISAQLFHYNLLKHIHETSDRDEDESSMDCDSTDEDRNTNRLNDLITINNFSTNTQDEVIHLNRYPLIGDTKSVLSNLHRLDPSREELMDPENMRSDPVESLKYLLDGLEFVDEVRNINRWLNIRNLLEDIFSRDDEPLVTMAKILWHTRYKRLWRFIDFLSAAGDQISDDDKGVVEEVIDSIYTLLNTAV